MFELPKLRRTFPELVVEIIPAPIYTKPHEPIDYTKVDYRGIIMKLKDIVKDNSVEFIRYRKGNLYYMISYGNELYEFPVPIDDCGDATFYNNDKAIMFMRYIRKALEDNTFVLAAL